MYLLLWKLSTKTLLASIQCQNLDKMIKLWKKYMVWLTCDVYLSTLYTLTMFLSLKGNNQIKRQSFLFYDLIFCERRWWLSRPGGSGGTGGAFQPPHFLANCTIFLYFLVKLNSFQPPASPLLPVINRALLPIGKHFQFYPVTNSK